MKNTPLIPGEVITVVLDFKTNLLPAIYPNETNTVTYTGTVVGRAEFDSKDSIRITGEAPMYIRVIPFSRIITLNGKPFHYTSSTPIPHSESPRTVIVEGSKGNKYTITISSDGTKKCSCPGYGYRGSCKHIDNFKE